MKIMAIFKCKICGGTLEITSGETVATCEYCGTKQTLPKLDDEKKANLFDRANHFRRNNDFDKAMGIYEQILNEDTEDAESYWSIVLCRYGIEYVEDPSSHKRVPTVNRAQFTSVFDDEDYKSAIKYADTHQKELYEKEATAINEIQKGILAISGQEEPFDVFICYKETDANGRRTQDSVLATELYHELTHEGYKVFFARITLEDKLGTAYEPYIFAALNSSKVMVVLGTKPEYFNAVWVRNEWSRYLALIKQGQKKMLIPAYRDMDPYDLPEEFSHLQAQDMSKLGFMQDLVRGITKLVPLDTASAVKETVVVQSSVSGNASALVKRGFLALEDGDWNKADGFFEQALNQDAEDAQAYLGKLMAELQVKTQDELKNCQEHFDSSTNYQKAIRFADSSLSSELKGYISFIKDRNTKKAKEEYNESIYLRALEEYKTSDIGKLNDAIELFSEIADWKDSKELIGKCQAKIEQIRVQEENERIERERLDAIAKAQAERAAKRNKKIAIITTPIVCAIIAFAILWTNVIQPNMEYNKALALMEAEKYEEAILTFKAMDGYKDSVDKIAECETGILDNKYDNAVALMKAEKYEEAISTFEAMDGYKDSNNKIAECMYDNAVVLLNSGNKLAALKEFQKCSSYKDSYNHIRNLINSSNAVEIVSAWSDHTVGLKSDGTVVAVGNNEYGQCNVLDWTDIVAISAGYKHTIGLKSDGTVVAVGENDGGQCEVQNWEDIVAVSAGAWNTVGLKSDGTVVAVGENSLGQCNLKSWKDIVAISVGNNHTVGLKSDGTVVAVGDNEYGQCNVLDWTNIVTISAGVRYTVGLKSDGTVVAVGENSLGQCNVKDWKDIVAVSAGVWNTVGLKSDGTVVAVGNIDTGYNVKGWKDIVAVSPGFDHTVGLKSDGTVVAVGYNDDGQCNIKGWPKLGIKFE